MKLKIMFLFCCLCVFSSCASTFMISRNQAAPATGKAIIYGQMDGMPGFGSSFVINLFERENNRLVQLFIKDNWNPNTSLPFAFELPSGNYELFSFLEIHQNGSSSSSQTYYLIKPSELKKVKEKGFFEDRNETFKLLEHDSINLLPNKILYLGEWSLSEVRPIITTNKELTDATIKKTFVNLLTSDAEYGKLQ